MFLSTDDTIAAVASAPGGAWRGILRVSGPQVGQCLSRCFEPRNIFDNPPKFASAQAGVLQLPGSWGALPGDLYYWPTARSYTRQPLAELHTIGSPPLLDAALRAICAAGARLAEPGEFTLRAFLAGRLDLTQAEAVLGVIDATNTGELDVALRQLAGGLATPLHQLRHHLLDLLAHLEAGLDFVEDDIEFISKYELQSQLDEIGIRIRQLLAQMSARGEVQHEFRVVLAGCPNVGKSSLFNALAGESAALVSDQPGTTRDYLSRRLSMGEHPCLFIDTAGIHAASDHESIASAAQDVAHQQHQEAHLRLFCLDATRPLNPWEQSELSKTDAGTSLTVLTKVDVLDPLTETRGCGVEGIRTSSQTGEGLSQLRSAIAEKLGELAVSSSDVVSNTATRCRESLRQAGESVERARLLAAESLGEELIAAELRLALEELGRVVGAVYTDDILDRIFSRFCIGK